MEALLQWKVHDSQGAYKAACKDIRAAAHLMSLYDTGATIRRNHQVVWTEGTDGWATEYHDETYNRIMERCVQHGPEGDATLNDRLQAAFDAGITTPRHIIDDALDWWITMHGADSVEYAKDPAEYRYHRIRRIRRSGSTAVTYYLWHTGDDWTLLCDFDQSDTQLLCPVSPDDEDAISTHLAYIGF